MGQVKDADGDDKDSDGEQKQQSFQMALALRAVNALWQRDPAAWTVDRDNMLNSKVDVSQLKTGIVQRRHAQSHKEPETAPCAA